MKIQKYDIKSCCGKTSIFYKLDRPIDKSIIAYLANNGFIEQEHFTRAGILYMHSETFILSGSIGQSNLQVKSKVSNYELKLQEFERLLEQMS